MPVARGCCCPMAREQHCGGWPDHPAHPVQTRHGVFASSGPLDVAEIDRQWKGNGVFKMILTQVEPLALPFSSSPVKIHEVCEDPWRSVKIWVWRYAWASPHFHQPLRHAVDHADARDAHKDPIPRYSSTGCGTRYSLTRQLETACHNCEFKSVDHRLMFNV